jgi:hypothetical protein
MFCTTGSWAAAPAADALPSWSDGPTKQAIVAFVAAVTDEAGTEYMPPAERIAVFDNDGTPWTEQPMYNQLAFALDRFKALLGAHPEWSEQQSYKAALEGDTAALGAAGMEGLMQLIMATHAGMTTTEFAATAEQWLATARHPRFGRPYTELVYRRANGFATYIVSGGGIAFMRPWTEGVCGVPPGQVNTRAGSAGVCCAISLRR